MVEHLTAAIEGKEMTPPAWLRRSGTDLAICVAFCTRLPLATSVPIEGGDVARASWALPVAGAFTGAVAAVVYWLAHRIALPPLPAAALALAAGMAITGALHEDGLADTADGFGGGKDREHKLAIMRDSRLGTYGACALAVSFMLRWSALASLAGPLAVAIALVAAHASARAALPAFLRWVPPARRGCGGTASGERRRGGSYRRVHIARRIWCARRSSVSFAAEPGERRHGVAEQAPDRRADRRRGRSAGAGGRVSCPAGRGRPSADLNQIPARKRVMTMMIAICIVPCMATA
jgi:cobalamin 5'-phosphate synthase/cobalamin synthase